MVEEPVDMRRIETVVRRIFPTEPIRIERVREGVSTYVYRMTYPYETFYLRVLPEEGQSFAPEVAVLTQLRQMQVKVPEVIYFEHYDETLQLSIMVMREIKGIPISQSLSLSEGEQQEILMEAGRDLAYLNKLTVSGFGWVARDQREATHLSAQWPTHRAFVLEYWDADLAYLARSVLRPSEIVQLEQICSRYDRWLDYEQGCLAHGDFDTTHVYQHDGHYTGIIDFGEIRGASCWYDLGHFHLRDGEALPYPLEAPLIHGYRGVATLPLDYAQRIRFNSVLINVRTLARSLQKRPYDRYTQHQLKVLREDIAALLIL